ncbi:MAG: hypothetical protein OXC80_00270 [Gammaproteobacteria bacterium]|nr:hypothetical protein [Gammaproteobacteria bacterium]
MDRTRQYYEAQGFEKPYAWANYEDVPFTQPKSRLSEMRLAVITTGALYDRQQSDPRFVDSGSIHDLPNHLFANDLAWDKDATHLNDLGSYLPIDVLQDLVDEGELGSIAPRFHSVPTEYSQRRTKEVDAPEVLKRCVEDGSDIALLIPL